MVKTTNAALFFLAAGILTSVTILSAYQVLFAIPLAYYLYLSFKSKEFRLPKSAWFLLGFTLVALISILVNYELIPKPSKNIGRLKYFLYGAGGIIVFRSWLVLASDQSKKFLVNVFLISIMVAGLYACWQFFLSGQRVKGLTDTMRYGYGSSMLLLTLLSALLHRKQIERWFEWRMGIPALIIGLIGMYLTYTRGGLLGFLCGVPLVLYFYRPKFGLMAGGGAALILLVLGGFYLFGPKYSGHRYLENKNNSSDVLRRSQWKAAIVAFQERPVLGWGFSNFHSQLKRIKEEQNLDRKEYNDAHAHNLFLEVAAGTGLIGLFFFLAWLIAWAIETYKANGLTRVLVLPFGVAFVITSQFEVTFDANNASMIFFLYAMSMARENDVK